MPSKRKLVHFKKAKEIAKQRKIQVKNDILIKKNKSILLKDRSIDKPQIFEKNIHLYRNLNFKEECDYKNSLKLIDDGDDLDIDTFAKFIIKT